MDSRTFDQIQADRNTFWGGATEHCFTTNDTAIRGERWADHGPRSLVLIECPICRACVAEGGMDDHAKWHAK